MVQRNVCIIITLKNPFQMNTNPTEIEFIIDLLDYHQDLTGILAIFHKAGVHTLKDNEFELLKFFAYEHVKCSEQLQDLVPKQWLLMEINEPSTAQFMQIQKHANTSSVPNLKLANIGLSKKIVFDRFIYN
jgi:hypothetical protein